MLFAGHMLMKHFILLLFSFILCRGGTASSLPVFHWKPVCPPADTLIVRLEKSTYSGNSRQEREKLIRTLYRLAETRPADSILEARAMYWDARAQIAKTDLDSAARLIRKASSLFDTSAWKYDYERLLFLEATVSLKKGDWQHYYSKMKRAENYFTAIRDKPMLAATCVNIGNYLKDMSENRRAYEYLSKAENLYWQCGLTEYVIKNRLNLSNVLFASGKTQEATALLQDLLNKPEARRDTVFYINILFSLNHQLDDRTEAGRYGYQAYRMAQRLNNGFLQAKAAAVVAIGLRQNRQPDSALNYFKQAIGYSLANRNYDFALPTLEGMIEIYSGKQQWDSAFRLQKTYIHLQDSLDRIKNIAEVNKIESRANLEKYEDRLQQATREMLLRKRIALAVIAGCFSIAILLCFIFWTLRNKEKAKKRLKELENKKYVLQLEKETLQNERYQMEIDSKNRELTSNTLMITDKNRVLRELLDYVETSGKKGEIPLKTASLLKNRIRINLDQENEWHYFKLHFEKVHPAFFSKLKEQRPNLSENELRLCAYIRIGMENKQIAQMLSLQPDTIKTARYRIRKKLELQQSESLEDWLRNI